MKGYLCILTFTTLTLAACIPSTRVPTLGSANPSASPPLPAKLTPILLPSNTEPPNSIPESSPVPAATVTPSPIPDSSDNIRLIRFLTKEIYFNQIDEKIEPEIEILNREGERLPKESFSLEWSTDRADLIEVSPQGIVTSRSSQGSGFIFVSISGTDMKASAQFFLKNFSDAGSSGSSGSTSTPTVQHCSENASCSIETFAGSGNAGDAGDFGAAEDAELNAPHGLFINDSGVTYIADSFNHKIREVLPSTFISTLVGINFNGFNGEEGDLRDTLFDFPNSITGDLEFLYLSDKVNNRIRLIDLEARTVKTIAGGGEEVRNDIAATSAKLSFPMGLALRDNKLYFADSLNHQIRAIDLDTQVITNVAGNFFFGNGGNGGPATEAFLDTPHDIAFDKLGNLYIADTFNHQIRKIDVNTGVISIFAGSNQSGYSGDGGAAIQATLDTPTGIAINSLGHLYIADSKNKVIRMVNKNTGRITTIAGGGNSATAQATAYMFDNPYEVYVDANDDIYVTDTVSNRILRIK